MVQVQMLRESYSSENKALKAGEVIEVTEARAKEMERRKIATRNVRAGRKAGPAAENKKAPEPENKAAKGSETK